MPSTISPPNTRNDDLVDFLLAHHVMEKRRDRCFVFLGRSICSRCLGWFIGMVMLGILIYNGFQTTDYFYLLPLPAFIDWGGRKLGFFALGKLMAFSTGLIMGMAIPYFILGVMGLKLIAIGGALLYVGLFFLISSYARKKVWIAPKT